MKVPTIVVDPTISYPLRQWIEDICTLLRGKVSFGQANTSEDRNIDCEFVSGTTDPVIGTEVGFTHTFGTVPQGYIVVSRDKAAHIYNGVTANTKTKIYLRSDVASVAFKVIIF